MPGASSENKTEKATPKKREDERKKGNLFQSADVVSSLSILAVFVMLRIAFPYLYRYLSNFIVTYLSYAATKSSLTQSGAMDVLRDAWVAILLVSSPVLFSSLLAAVLATGMQTRFKFSGEKIKFKFSNINPIEGFKRLFSIRSVAELLKSIAKTAAIGYVMYLQMRKICAGCIAMMGSDLLESAVGILNDIMDMVIQMTLVFIAIAAADYFFQWWDFERNIRMTKQELKEEYKELEGNPETKGRIRQVQRKISGRRMMQQVPQADVIVRNPTHVAVALRYRAEEDGAPVVVAKGQDYLALKIIEIAQQHHIPMKEDRPLAHALYAAVEVNAQIPQEFYQAMAEVMAWVYRLKQEGEER
ncbi:flagellar biosynthesis protein FlhB [Caproiciproducens sp. NJN-50]|uniref:flagellar biosynthesis protein FlhB n=1 Tax=Acutalibacteraceae TaxID=3082771 RepID=UPI000FFE2854|nr:MULTISPECIES: flagellar biosynthesis protein FlhB [Acutalibacteraceae]QAT50676.1 flagellar biosynthesis protein FlhB [Caproiciproducens sp. NJN-50]